MIHKVIIDGNNFDDIMEFYDEVERILTKDLNWRIGQNLDAFFAGNQFQIIGTNAGM